MGSSKDADRKLAAKRHDQEQRAISVAAVLTITLIVIAIIAGGVLMFFYGVDVRGVTD